MKPNVIVPDGLPPTDLVLEDLEVGTGAEAVAGKSVTVHYVGISWSTGGEFDSSWNRDELFSFPLGAGHVIQGWDDGVTGMLVGGRRRITIPPELGYGSRGAGGVIGPNEAQRIQMHGDFIHHMQASGKVLFANESDAMDFLLDRTAIDVQGNGAQFHVRPPTAARSKWQVTVEYAGQSHALPAEGLLL